MAIEDKVLLLRMDRIRTDGKTQSRAKLCSDTAAKYAEEMKGGAVFPPLIVFRGVDDRTPDDKTVYDWLASGFHRYKAKEQNGNKTAECIVKEGSRRDALLFSVSENHKHGLQRTNEDKRYAVRLLLEEEAWWDRTNGWIAEKCHVNPKLPAIIREEMEEEWRLEEERNKAAEAVASSLGVAHSETAKPKGGRGNRSRKGRTRKGATRTINTENIGKGNGKKGYRERPVYPSQFDRHRDPKAHAAKLVQLGRSRKKHARQSLEAGESEQEAVAAFLEVRRSIPVER